MIIVFDKNSKEFIRWHGSNSGNLTNNIKVLRRTLDLEKDEDFIIVSDESDFAKKVMG